MLREHKLNRPAAVVADLRAVGVNDHALFDRVVAGGNKALAPLYLHDTDAAGGDLVYIL